MLRIGKRFERFAPPYAKVPLMKLLTLTLPLILLATPSTWAQEVTAEFDQGADFSKHKTFAIREGIWSSVCATPAHNLWSVAASPPWKSTTQVGSMANWLSPPSFCTNMTDSDGF